MQVFEAPTEQNALLLTHHVSHSRNALVVDH
jgi:hypothetical protein